MRKYGRSIKFELLRHLAAHFGHQPLFELSSLIYKVKIMIDLEKI
jgi:hypothetical protein